jgi:hypothetical protein
MAIIPKYTQQRSIPGTTGQQMAPLSIVGSSPLKTVGGAGMAISGVLSEASQRIEAREALIKSTEIKTEYENEELQEYTAFLDTANIRDPQALDTYAAEQEKRLQKKLTAFSGNADQRAKLEADLRGRQGAYMQQLITKSNTAQRQFIADAAVSEITPIVADLTKNPNNFKAAFGKIDGIVSKFSDGMDAAAEKNLREQGYAMVMDNTVGGLIRRGKWEEANSMLEDNPLLSRYLPESKRSQYETQIASFANKQTELQQEMMARTSAIKALQDQGVAVDPSKAANFVIGSDVSPDKSFAQQVQEKFNGLGVPEDQRTPQAAAAVMGIKLPGTTEMDPNKDYFQDGGRTLLTPQGAGKKVKPYIEAATGTRTRLSSIETLYKAAKEGNKAAALGVLQGYLKLIDDGAVVRDSDIKLAESTTSLATRFQTAIQSATEGKGVSDALVEEAYKASQAFTTRALEISKSFVDGYQKDTGYRLIELGIPQSSYDMVFDGVRQSGARAELNMPQGNVVVDPATPANVPSDVNFTVGADGTLTENTAITKPTEQPDKKKKAR